MKTAGTALTGRLRRRGVAALLATLLPATAVTAAVAASPTAGAHVRSASYQHAKFATQCKAVRAKYKGLPATINVAISPFSPPFDTTNKTQKITGLEPNLLSDVAGCLGFKISYSSEGFAAVITSVQTGRSLLGLTGIFLTPTREKIIAFVPYMLSQTQVITTPALVKKIHTVMSLCGLSTGVTSGSVELKYFQTLSKKCVAAHKGAISISIFTKITTIFASLVAGHFDFSAGASFLNGPVLKEYPGKLATSIFLPGTKVKIGIGVEKSDVELGEAVAAAMQLVQHDGIETSLLAHWGFTEIPELETPAVYTR